MSDYEALTQKAWDILETNDQGAFTIPAMGLYPHQWLWDSCFIAIGLRHKDIDRAKAEVLSLLRGQWSNGMVPNIIFNSAPHFRTERQFWRSHVSPFAPSDISTSGVTQPPLIAEAVFRIGQVMSSGEKRSWYQSVYPALVKYHKWLYKERDPQNLGLVLCIHPYESGMDNSPPWIESLNNGAIPRWIGAMEAVKLERLANVFRRDTKRIPPGQRMNTFEALAYMMAVLKLRRKNYDINKILANPKLINYDLAFNCIFYRSNQILEKIAKDIGRQLPKNLQEKITLSSESLDELWDASRAEYFSKSYPNNLLIKQSSVAHLLSLYSGSITQERAKDIVLELKNPASYWLKFPLPSVPAHSKYFNPIKYWQGPSWININWLIIDGLKRYGYESEAQELKNRTLKLIEKSSFYEYFNPKNGEPEGAEGFSWTPALLIDLLNDN